jgi:hypothetical protein
MPRKILKKRLTFGARYEDVIQECYENHKLDRVSRVCHSLCGAAHAAAITFSTHESDRVSDRSGVADHHSVYVVYLRNPKGDGRAAYYVGMTADEGLQKYKGGVSRVVGSTGCVVPSCRALDPMPNAEPSDGAFLAEACASGL